MLVSVIIGIIGLVVMMIIMTPLAVDLIDEETKEKMASDISKMVKDIWSNFEEALIAMVIIALIIGVILICMNICELGFTICFISMFAPIFILPIYEWIDDTFIDIKNSK